MDELSAVLSALADPTRRDILARLRAGDATVGELASRYPISPQAVSKHVRVLAEAGLVSRRREAQRRPVHLEPAALDLVGRWLGQQRAPAPAAPAEPAPVPAGSDDRPRPRPGASPTGSGPGHVRGSHRAGEPTPPGSPTRPTATRARPAEHGRHRADIDPPARDGADGAGLERR